MSAFDRCRTRAGTSRCTCRRKARTPLVSSKSTTTPVVVASVYALWDYGWLPLGAKPRYAHTSLHRAISDLTPALDTAVHGMPVILGGDFNTSSSFRSPHREAFRTVHDRLSGLGLHNISLRPKDELLDGCPCADERCRHLQTYEGLVPYQDDYLYVSENLVRGARLLGIDRTPAVEAVSDHFPLMVDVTCDAISSESSSRISGAGCHSIRQWHRRTNRST